MDLENNEYSHLEELGGSNYEIVDGEPNIKGWEVKIDQGEVIGQVDELLFDPQSRNVRYVIVKLDGDGVGVEQRKFLIPIGTAQLDDKEDLVLLPNISLRQIAALPLYEKGKVSLGTEFLVRSVIESRPDGFPEPEYEKEGFYTHEHFNEDKFYNRNILQQATEDPTPVKESLDAESVRAVHRIAERPASVYTSPEEHAKQEIKE